MQKYKSFLLILFTFFITVNFSAQDFKAVHDGVEYAEVTRKLGDDPVKINLLRLDLKKVRLDVHHALDAAIGTETTSSIATRKGAVAAINAGFFRLDTSVFAGDAAGLLMIDNKIWSEALMPRAALSFINSPIETIAVIQQMTAKVTSSRLDQFEITFGINRERGVDDIVIYTPEFHSTTLTNNEGDEYTIIRKKVQPILISRGNSRIPKKGYVISVSGKMRSDIRRTLKKGVSIRKNLAPKPTISVSKFETDIVGGVPQLIRSGKIDITWEQEKSSKAFVETRHPRTAVAKMKDGKFLMITVDGRQPGVSVGMNLNELAAYLLEIGAMDAMNLDGGGSTTMFLDGKVVNTPSGKGVERKVSDAILVTLRKKK
ncbi:MAG: phosphodiester glycosidase family protein [Pyrinomonadaceae bacterium]